MRMTKKIPISKLVIEALIISSSLVIGNWSFAQDVGDLVLKQGIGVRAAGMGGAFTAVANDASAIYYNPAGLAEPGIAYSFGNLDSEQINNEFGFSQMKLAFLGYSEGKVKNPNGDEITFTAMGFGNRSGWVSWGTNYKSLDWNISGIKDSGWTADIGFLLKIAPQFRVGLVVQDVLTTKSRLVPASGRIGLCFRPFDSQLILAADAEIYKSSPWWGHLGVETNLAKGLTIRGGIDRGNPTAGASLDLMLFSLDYAVLFPPDGKNLQRFEAGLKILPEKERPFSLIKPKEFALIDFSGAIKGGQTEYSFLGGIRPGLDSLLEKIRRASRDRSIDGIVIRLGGFSGGLGGAAAVQEVRAELSRAREKGKKIIAYVEGSALGDEYYLASAADKIVAAPGSAIGGFGKSIEIYRMAGFFEKLGIEWQIFSKGKYKTSFDWLSPKMSKEQKEMVEGIVGEVYRQMLTDIAESRKMKIEKVKEIGDGMIFPAQLAKKMGLIDEVGYLRDVCRVAGEVCGSKDEAKIVEPRLLEPEESFLTQVFGVAVIEIDGELVTGSGGQNLIFGGTYVGSDKIVRDIRQASDDLTVRAILVRIDSPGGSSVAAGEIYRALQYAREKGKLIIASLGSVAASGGYYIASAADKIVADRSTITGSIGVIGYLPTFSQLLKNVGVSADVVKEGSHADMFSGLRKLTTVEVQALQRIIGESYDDFVNAVASGRKLATKEVEAVAQGRVYTGSQALELKLIDRIGGFSDALDLIKEEAKIIGEPRLIYYRQPNPFLPLTEGVTSVLGLPPWSQ